MNALTFGAKVAEAHTPFLPENLEAYDTLSEGAIKDYGRGAYNQGGNAMNQDYQTGLAGGAGAGAGLALVHELLRRKSEEEKNQSLGRKALRYAGKGGLGLLAGAGAGGLLQAVRAS